VLECQRGLDQTGVPAAASRWPMLLFTDPRAQNCLRAVPRRKALVNAATSIGSPIGVAVPCAST